MSFWSTKDPEERDAVVEDYRVPKKQLQERNLEERGHRMKR